MGFSRGSTRSFPWHPAEEIWDKGGHGHWTSLFSGGGQKGLRKQKGSRIWPRIIAAYSGNSSLLTLSEGLLSSLPSDYTFTGPNLDYSKNTLLRQLKEDKKQFVAVFEEQKFVDTNFKYSHKLISLYKIVIVFKKQYYLTMMLHAYSIYNLYI